MTKLYIAGTNREVRKGGCGRLDGVLGRNGSLTGLARILESFYYVRDWQTECIGEFRGFMLDSGAFTFRHNSKKRIDMPSYIDAYMHYVKENNVKLYFELDIDDIIGLDDVYKYRKVIEKYTGRQSIPVWHVNRGHDEWLRMCDEYDYVAIGGIARSGRAKVEPMVPRMVSEAHDRSTKVHGLGYARTAKLEKMGFDSIDSASWTWGLKRNFLFMWDGRSMSYNGFTRCPDVTSSDIQEHNFREWLAMSLDLEFGAGTSARLLGKDKILKIAYG